MEASQSKERPPALSSPRQRRGRPQKKPIFDNCFFWKPVLENPSNSLKSFLEQNGKHFALRLPSFRLISLGLLIDNPNTYRGIEVAEARLYDPSRQGDLVPSKPVETAGDASFRFSRH